MFTNFVTSLVCFKIIDLFIWINFVKYCNALGPEILVYAWIFLGDFKLMLKKTTMNRSINFYIDSFIKICYV